MHALLIYHFAGPRLKHNIEFDGHSPESEVLQAEPVEETAFVSEGTTKYVSPLISFVHEIENNGLNVLFILNICHMVMP